MGDNRNAHKILFGKSEGKRIRRIYKHRWVYNNRMDLREIGWDGVDWIHLAQDRGQWRDIVNTVMKFLFP
jgi:hypothetical protein